MMPRPRAHTLRACAAGVLLAAAPAVAHAAQASAGTAEVAVHLMPRRVRIAPGETARIALRLEPAPGWYVYAPDPGDVGLPLRVEWEAPEGVRVTPLAWPSAAPRVVDGRWTSLVYSMAVEAEGEIRIAADAEPGATLRVAATVAWGVCREVCLPQSARLVVEVDVVAPTRAAAVPLRTAPRRFAGRPPDGVHADSPASHGATPAPRLTLLPQPPRPAARRRAVWPARPRAARSRRRCARAAAHRTARGRSARS